MPALLSVLYGLLAYLVGVAALACFICFSGDLLLPRPQETVTAVTLAGAVRVDIFLLSLFAIQHSLMARRTFKRWWVRVVPRPVERSTYLLATSIVLGLLIWQWRPIPAPVVWRIENTFAAYLLWTMFWLGWAITLLSTFLINHFELFGLQQVFARLTGREAAAPEFRTPLFYRYVRHPLYLGILLGLWSVPVMTAGHLLLSAGLTGYIVVGIWFEERDLVAAFGERYRRYRAEVGMLWPRRSRPGSAPGLVKALTRARSGTGPVRGRGSSGQDRSVT